MSYLYSACMERGFKSGLVEVRKVASIVLKVPMETSLLTDLVTI